MARFDLSDQECTVIHTLLPKQGRGPQRVHLALRIPEHSAGHSDNIRPPKPEYPATFGSLS